MTHILGILITLGLVGFVLYLFNTLVPIQQPYKTVINAIVGVLVFLWLLCALGIYCYHGIG